MIANYYHTSQGIWVAMDRIRAASSIILRIQLQIFNDRSTVGTPIR